MIKGSANGAGDLGFDSRAGQIEHSVESARHRCDVPSELCYSGDKLWIWAPPPVTCFGVIPPV